jgi:hypothetical protein
MRDRKREGFRLSTRQRGSLTSVPCILWRAPAYLRQSGTSRHPISTTSNIQFFHEFEHPRPTACPAWKSHPEGYLPLPFVLSQPHKGFLIFFKAALLFTLLVTLSLNSGPHTCPTTTAPSSWRLQFYGLTRSDLLAWLYPSCQMNYGYV